MSNKITDGVRSVFSKLARRQGPEDTADEERVDQVAQNDQPTAVDQPTVVDQPAQVKQSVEFDQSVGAGQDVSDEPAVSAAATKPSKHRSIGLWAITVFLAFSAAIYLPSIGSIAMIVASVLMCPAERVRNLIPLQRITDRLPVGNMSPDKVRGILAGALFLLGVMFVPAKGEFSINSYLDLQSAKAAAPRIVEYTKDAINAFDYIECDDENVKLSIKDDVNATEVGDQRITVELEESVFSKEEELVVQVKDTRAPEIELKEDEITVELGGDFDPNSVVASVSDPVDGSLAMTQEVPTAQGSDVGLERFYDAGWYMIVGDLTTDAAGSNEMSVIAYDQHGNASTEEFIVKVIDPLDGVSLKAKSGNVEYSNKDVDAASLVECSDKDTKVTAKNKLDLRKVGKKSVKFTLAKGKSTREETVEFNVRDTKKPQIELASEGIEITEGEGFDPYGNVTSVRDEVDGDLARVDEEQKDNGDGWYTITEVSDLEKVGTHHPKVVACDRNGNRESREFSVTVKKAPEPEPEPPETSGGGAASGVVSSGGGSGSFPDYERGGEISEGTTYVLNKRSKKFHHTWCRYAEETAAHNRRDVTMSREEVIGMGYKPCKVCEP